MKTCGCSNFEVVSIMSNIMASVRIEMFLTLSGLLIFRDLMNICIFSSLNELVGM